MLKEYKAKTNLFIGIGILIDLFGMVLLPAGGAKIIAGLIGRALLVTGCVFYARGKGHHGAWGLLGLLSLLGLIVLVCFKDKNKI